MYVCSRGICHNGVSQLILRLLMHRFINVTGKLSGNYSVAVLAEPFDLLITYLLISDRYFTNMFDFICSFHTTCIHTDMKGYILPL